MYGLGCFVAEFAGWVVVVAAAGSGSAATLGASASVRPKMVEARREARMSICNAGELFLRMSQSYDSEVDAISVVKRTMLCTRSTYVDIEQYTYRQAQPPRRSAIKAGCRWHRLSAVAAIPRRSQSTHRRALSDWRPVCQRRKLARGRNVACR